MENVLNSAAEVLNSDYYKLLYLYKYKDEDRSYKNRFFILPQHYDLPSPLISNLNKQEFDVTNHENTDTMTKLYDNSIAYYRSSWDNDDGKKSCGIFLFVKQEFRGKGLLYYLYIVNAQLAADKGFLRHEADFGVHVDTDGLSESSRKRKIHKVFYKTYGVIACKLQSADAPDFYGYTTVISGSIVTKRFCQKYIKQFPEFYNQNCSWCKDASIRGDGKTKKRKIKKRKIKKRKTKKRKTKKRKTKKRKTKKIENNLKYH